MFPHPTILCYPIESSVATAGDNSSRLLAGAGVNAKLANQATTTVIKLPKNTYHVQAIFVAKNM